MQMRSHRFISADANSDRGVALLTTMMIMMLMSALMIGLTTTVMSDQRFRYIDRDRAKAFYGANSGLEKLTAELADLFFVNVAPTAAQITALETSPPAVPDVTFVTSGTGHYGVTLLGSSSGQITTGPYQGLIALKKTYELNSSVRTVDGGEAHLKRSMETVAIPVFQFGMFSDVDLSFHAGPNFNFGGRVHTNGNLFLAQGDGTTLTLPEKVTAVNELIRNQLVNGVNIPVSNHEGTVRVATAPGTFRNLTATEGSLAGGVGSAANASWPTISLSTYNSYIRTGKTGAKVLNLPLLTSGGANTDLVRRPVANEDVTNDVLFGERFFSKVSLRILLSDVAADITNLPSVTATAPVPLEDWNTNLPAGYGPIDAAHPPVARSPGLNTATLNADPGAGTVDLSFAAGALGAYFTPPPLNMTVAGTDYTVTCAGRGTAGNTFTGCLNNPAPPVLDVPAGTSVSATVDNQIVTTQAVGAFNSGNNGVLGTLTVSNNSTAPFVHNTFWVRDAVGAEGFTATLITCLGNTATQLLSCSNVPAAVNNNHQVSTEALTPAGTGLIGGVIKIEMQATNGTWQDVTMEILNLGIGGPNLGNANGQCADPTPNAVLRLQRLRDNAAAAAGGCTYAGSTKPTDYWPNVLFDTREALQRDVNPGTGNLIMGGVMHYVAIDVANLSRWFRGQIGASGANALSNNGYSVYFSDRRNNRDLLSRETGEYGFEDVVNPASAGVPNAVLDSGEDVNATGTLETYGQFPSFGGAANTVPAGSTAPFDNVANIRPTSIMRPGQAQSNRAYLFRRALKLINGGLGNIVAPGLTFATENPVYVQGDFNANAAGFGDPHVATSIIADGVTLLSGNWSDAVSFSSPYTPGNRVRSTQSYYRVAIIAGKNAPFPQPSGTASDFGTDGGAHNFLRMLETGGTVNYRGSIATFYYNRQAVGVYKCCSTVYGAPTRVFNFDTDFLDPALLPPLTPVFRDLNSLGFTQEIRPGH